MASFAFTRPARSFHNGGTGTCGNCHSMHEGSSGGSLLLASDPSSVCLNCHAGPGGVDSPDIYSADGSALTPGGDFYWLTKTFSWDGGSSSGDSHGHNVIARDFNLQQDLRHSYSPGGYYPSADLSCISCHDPHGQIAGGTSKGRPPVSVSGSYGELPAAGTISGNYRLLGDSYYQTSSGYQFTHDAPVARQNKSRPFGETDVSHVDYGAGMSQWCANCHADMLSASHQIEVDGFAHPSGSYGLLTSSTIDMYNSYVKTGDLTGNSTNAYLQFVPFERGTSDSQQLDPLGTSGPGTNSQVLCLTCHRAHASAFRAIGRWDLDVDLLANSHPSEGDGGVTGNDVYYSYYGRDIVTEFGSSQGPFCEKCHGW